jgi:hypothetical protein
VRSPSAKLIAIAVALAVAHASCASRRTGPPPEIPSRAAQPGERYLDLGTVELRSTDPDEMREQLAAEAQRLGADGFYLEEGYDPNGPADGPRPFYPGSFASNDLRGLMLLLLIFLPFYLLFMLGKETNRPKIVLRAYRVVRAAPQVEHAYPTIPEALCAP